MVEKLVPDSSLENENWAYLWIDSLKFDTVCFNCMANWVLLKYIEIKLQSTCFHLIWSLSKKKGDLELVTLPHFPHIFEEKYFFCYVLKWFLNWSLNG